MTQTFSKPRKRSMTIVSVLLVLMLLATFVSAAPTSAAACTWEHRVRWGDTLGRISRYYGATISDLVTWNNLSSANLIFLGSTLCVEMDGAGPNPVFGTAYQVRWGDTLSYLAWVFGDSLTELARANGLGNIDVIFAGETLYHSP